MPGRARPVGTLVGTNGSEGCRLRPRSFRHLSRPPEVGPVSLDIRSPAYSRPGCSSGTPRPPRTRSSGLPFALRVPRCPIWSPLGASTGNGGPLGPRTGPFPGTATTFLRLQGRASGAPYGRVFDGAKTAPPLTLVFPGKTIGIYRKAGPGETCPGSSRARTGPV